MGVELNGIAHIQLTVNDPKRCVPFWEDLCHFLGMETLVRGDNIVYCIGSRTGILVRGLHHFCFRARSREDVDAVHEYLTDTTDVHIVHAPEDGSHFAPGYYSILFEDPDGIRVEINYVPGKGHFGEMGRLGPDGPGPATTLRDDGITGSPREA